MKVLVVDDEPLARDRLIRFLTEIDFVDGTLTASNGEEALQKLQTQVFDVVLLDIRMPGISGIEVAERIGQLAKPPAIIFCTAFDDYAIEAFQVNAQNYLLKPVKRAVLETTLERATRLNQAQASALTEMSDIPSVVVQSGREKERIPLADVHYFRAEQKYVSLFSEQGERICDESLKVIEESYPEHLIRTHRNTLVNKARILKLSRDADGVFSVSLKGLEVDLVVSRRHAKYIKQLFNDENP